MWTFLRLVATLSDHAARWYILRALTMAAPRRFRDRRRRDPMNIRDTPNGCLVSAALAADPSDTLVLGFNAAISPTLTMFEAWNFAGETATAINQLSAREVEITLSNPIAVGVLIDTQPYDPTFFGPNIVGQYANVATSGA